MGLRKFFGDPGLKEADKTKTEYSSYIICYFFSFSYTRYWRRKADIMGGICLPSEVNGVMVDRERPLSDFPWLLSVL